MKAPLTTTTTLLLLTSLLVSLTDAAMVGQCDPNWVADYPELLPDDTDCALFWVCNQDGSIGSMTCDVGTWFNPTDDICDLPSNVVDAPCLQK